MKPLPSCFLAVLMGLATAGTADAQNENDPPAGAKPEDLERVVPAYDPGSHTRPIAALGFSKDGSKLITVGRDYTVQVWSTATGERLDILRLPGYGFEKDIARLPWDFAAVSA